MMTDKTLPLVGFDRFVRRTWLDHALEMAARGCESADVKKWIENEVKGKDAARKTANLLVNFWVRRYPETGPLRDRGILLSREVDEKNWIALHWGMAIANFGIFRTSVGAMGRLLQLQGEFQRDDVKSRVSENYSNSGTVPRVVDRILQSVTEWGILKIEGSCYRKSATYSLVDEKLVGWILEAYLLSDIRTVLEVRDLVGAPELFPFRLPENVGLLIRNSSRFSVEREGYDREIVFIREWAV